MGVSRQGRLGMRLEVFAETVVTVGCERRWAGGVLGGGGGELLGCMLVARHLQCSSTHPLPSCLIPTPHSLLHTLYTLHKPSPTLTDTMAMHKEARAIGCVCSTSPNSCSS